MDLASAIHLRVLDGTTLDEKLADDPTLVHRVVKYGRSFLHEVCSLGRADLARVLLQRGADPNLVDDADDTPLKCAMEALECSPEGRLLMELLVDHGADPSLTFNPLLHLGVLRKFPPDALRFLVGIGCDPNQLDGDHDPPWASAVLNGMLDGSHPPHRVAQLRELLALGANPDVHNFRGNRLDQELSPQQLGALFADILAARSRVRGT